MKPGHVAIIAACAGNLLEWYDCTLYALFATYIAGSFFPSRLGVALLTMPFFERRRAAAGAVASQVPA